MINNKSRQPGQSKKNKQTKKQSNNNNNETKKAIVLQSWEFYNHRDTLSVHRRGGNNVKEVMTSESRNKLIIVENKIT